MAARRLAVIAPDQANPKTASAVVNPARRACRRSQEAHGLVTRPICRDVCGSIAATMRQGSTGTRSAGSCGSTG